MFVEYLVVQVRRRAKLKRGLGYQSGRLEAQGDFGPERVHG